MKLTARQRGALLVLGVLVSGWLAIFGDKTPPDQLKSVGAHAPSRMDSVQERATEPRVWQLVEAEVPGRISHGLPARTHGDSRAGGARGSPSVVLFAATSWQPAPKQEALQDVRPSAPPLPFLVLGKKLQEGRWEVFLSRGDQTLIVSSGDEIDGVYRVKRLEPPMLVFEYLPLSEEQTLDVGGFE